jgi:hypothetical protein
MMVLLRWRERRDPSPEDVTVDSLHPDRGSVRERLYGIQRANDPYSFRPRLEDWDDNTTTWVIGPEEDEGFFGSKPMVFRLVEPVWPRTP